MDFRIQYLVSFFCLAAFTFNSSHASDPTEKDAERARRIVQDALQSEASGSDVSRGELLAQANSLFTDEPSIHWQQGQIRNGKEWNSYPNSVALAKNSKELEEYRILRDASKPTLESQSELVRYCSRHGLKDQAIAHWSAIAELDPENEEAKNQLGFEKFEGQWIHKTELAVEREKAKRVSESLQQKLPELRRLAKDLVLGKQNENQAVVTLSQEVDVDSIPAWELCLSSAHKQGAAVVVETLKQSSAPEATLSLARHATWVADFGVRDAASNVLKSRDQNAYVPAMLSELQGPWLATRQWAFDGNDRLVYRYSLIADGKDQQALRVLDETYFLTGNVSNAFSLAAGAATRSRIQSEAIRRNTNAMIQARNDQVINALREITGEREMKSPQDWWEWWDDRNEVYSTSEKPIVTSYAYNTVSVRGSSPEPLTGGSRSRIGRSEGQRKECLAGGTPILTQRGPIAIERIRIGDLVLSKHFETGEVRFQPVLRTTVREPELLIRITLSAESEGKSQVIRASGGHPFWVSGKGWVRARDMEAGARLHGLERFTQVKEVEVEEKATKTYNLVVSDFHSYFVGPDAILSHDNSIVKPIQCLIPGLKIN